MIIGQRVNTKYGTGTVIEFERITNVITYVSEYAEGDRIAVLLDDPTLWPYGKGNPHFLIQDITK
jgi:hypothetical protein